MGEAKRRGTYEDRKAEALERQMSEDLTARHPRVLTVGTPRNRINPQLAALLALAGVGAHIADQVVYRDIPWIQPPKEL